MSDRLAAKLGFEECVVVWLGKVTILRDVLHNSEDIWVSQVRVLLTMKPNNLVEEVSSSLVPCTDSAKV